MPDIYDPRNQSALGDTDRQRARMLGLLRGLFLFLLVIFTALVIVQDSATHGGFELARWWPLAVGGMLLFFAGFIALDVLTPKRKLSTVSAIFVGLIAGVLVTVIIGTVLDLFSDIYGLTETRLLAPFKVMLGLGICYLTVSTVLQTQDDFRLVIPYVEFARKIRGPRPILLDTSALIDGRVLEVSELGLFQSPLVAPRCVIEELQRLSDSADRLKRARGRRGLEMLTRLQRVSRVDVSIEEAEVPGATVDQKIIELARALPAMILTADIGLARVAAIEGLFTLNLNDVANALRQNAVPGEPMTVSLLRRGEQPGQAVGYLPDGTMVVVDDAVDLIGSEATVIVGSALQTSAGRMIFARPQGREAPRPRQIEPELPEREPEPSSNSALDNRAVPQPAIEAEPQPPQPMRAAAPAEPPERERAPFPRPDPSGRLSRRNPRRG
jgi:uncharacterized protein YacL